MFVAEVLFFSGVLVACAFFVLLYKWQRLDLFDIYVVLISCYFGFYTIGDILRHQIQNPSRWVAFLTFSYVIVPLVLTWLVINILIPAKNKVVFTRGLSLKLAADTLNQTPGLFLNIFFGCLISFKLFEVFYYGVQFSYDATTLTSLGYKSNYFVSSIDSLYYAFIAMCIVLYALRMFRAKFLSFHFCWYVFALCSLFAVSVLYRREGIFNFIFLFSIAYILTHRVRIFSFKLSLFVVGVSLFSLVAFGNFEHYRGMLFYGGSSNSHVQNASKHYHINYRDIKADLSQQYDLASRNLRSLAGRISMWRFNYQVVTAQENNQAASLHGTLSKHALLNSMPRILWRDKSVVNIPGLLMSHYGLKYTGYDWNYYGFIVADFGKYALCIMTLFLIGWFCISGFILSMVRRQPILYSLCFGLVLNSIFWVSGSYENIFLLFRNIGLTMLLYFFIRIFYTGFALKGWAMVCQCSRRKFKSH